MDTPQRRTQIMAVVSSQPGVGKTTVAVNLAASLFKSGYPTLLVDLDSQADASRALGVQNADGSRSAYGVLAGTATVSGTRLPTASGIDLVPGHQDLAKLEQGPLTIAGRSLHAAVSEVANDYAFIFLDCPSGENQVTRCAEEIARHLLIPYRPEAGQFVPAACSELIVRASHSWAISLVANQVSPNDPTTPAVGHLRVAGRQVRHLGCVRASKAFQEAYRQGLPPVSRGSDDAAVAQDFAALAMTLTAGDPGHPGETAA